jgi:hypothetical protein
MGSHAEGGLAVQYQRLFYVKLNTNHLNPGRIQHSVEGRPVPYPHSLTIEKIQPQDEEVMIRYLDEEGNELTHSHSYSLADAFGDALYEFGIQPHEWASLAPVDQNSN